MASVDLLEPSHPQFGLRHLLARLGVSREDVGDWPGREKEARAERGGEPSVSFEGQPEHAVLPGIIAHCFAISN